MWQKKETTNSANVYYWVEFMLVLSYNKTNSALIVHTVSAVCVCVESLVTSGGSVVTLHPVRGRVQRVGLLHGLVALVHAPELGAFEHVYVTVCPRERSVHVAGDAVEDVTDGFGIRAEVCWTDLIPLPVSRALMAEGGEWFSRRHQDNNLYIFIFILSSYFEKQQLLVLGEVQGWVDVCREVGQRFGETRVQFEACVSPHFITCEKTFSKENTITYWNKWRCRCCASSNCDSTFQEVGLPGPLRVNGCVDVSWQLLPQSRDVNGRVVAGAGQRPHEPAAEDIRLM